MVAFAASPLSPAAVDELVLELQEVEEVEVVIALEVGVRGLVGELVEEAEVIEDVEVAVALAVGDGGVAPSARPL